MKTPYSSAVCSRRVVRRHDTSRRAPSKTPILVLVFPTSMTSSIGGLHGHLAREDPHRLAAVRPDHQCAVVGKVYDHANPAVARPHLSPDAIRALEPGLPETRQARGEEALVPVVEGFQHRPPRLPETAHAARLHAHRGGEGPPRIGEEGLVDVQPDTQDDVGQSIRPRGGGFRQYPADLPLAHEDVVGPADPGP